MSILPLVETMEAMIASMPLNQGTRSYMCFCATIVSRRCLALIAYFFFLVLLADDARGHRAVVLGQLEALMAFFVQADIDKDRKHAGASCEKQLRRLMRHVKGLDEYVLEGISDRSQILLAPPYKRFTDPRPVRPPPQPRGGAGHAQQHAQQQHAQQQPSPVYYQQVAQQPVYASQTQAQPQCPPGYQLTAIAPATGSPPGGGRAPPRGIAITKPTEVFPAAHFTRPCTYCAHNGHAGDNCWKTYPELRSASGH